jgi:hypothetical protein
LVVFSGEDGEEQGGWQARFKRWRRMSLIGLCLSMGGGLVVVIGELWYWSSPGARDGWGMEAVWGLALVLLAAGICATLWAAGRTRALSQAIDAQWQQRVLSMERGGADD